MAELKRVVLSIQQIILLIIGVAVVFFAFLNLFIASMLILGGVVLLAVVVYLRETNRSTATSLAFGNVLSGYRAVGASKQFRA